MNYCKKNITLLLFLLMIFSVACSKSDTPQNSVPKAPTNLQVSVQIVGASATAPDGDGTGTVNISVSAANATTYQIVLPTEGNKTFTLNNPAGGTVSYTFTNNPNTTTTYPIQVNVYNGSVKKDSTVYAKVYSGVLKSDVALWLTTPDKNVLFQQQNVALNFASSTNSNPAITVDATQKFQTIDGFGYTLTGGSATLINGLAPTTKDNFLKELISTDSAHIGVSYLRLSIGASDLSATAFSYDDSPGDSTLQNFSIGMEKTDLIPVLQKILALNPSIKIVAAPWSAPAWMKTNNNMYGGGDNPGILKPECYAIYANYFVKYIQAMAAEGITIDAITPQNEPLNAYNNPSMLMQAGEQNIFIKTYLAPAFATNNIKTKIIVYDHNLDHPEYATSIFSDPVTVNLVDGSAFHLYAGNIGTMSSVHNQFPNKNLYFTEQYTSATGNFGGDLQWHIENVIVGATANWSRNAIEWNLASDPNQNPHLNGGCSDCLGAVTINGSAIVQRNQSYYVVAHAAKFVRPGSVRIASTAVANMPNVAFQTPDGKRVLIVLNKSTANTTFNISFNGKIVSPTLPAGAVGTFVW
ncbi:MAG: glucosylceramidase [Chitinophagaceae bacterium]|jgi:glucosylceramidase|nr:glucosylceramidase [Chitinophagaceae bacterium]